ncbi:MAG: hypothetical protein ABEK12_01415 [Candidatus Nanohaloarchaea archaeon]
MVSFTLASAALLTGLITTEQFRAGERQPAVTQCRYADIDIFAASYSPDRDEVAVKVMNAETVDLENVTVTAERDGAVQGRASIPVLPVGGLKQAVLPGVEQVPDRVTAVSSQCPGVTATARDIAVR